MHACMYLIAEPFRWKFTRDDLERVAEASVRARINPASLDCVMGSDSRLGALGGTRDGRHAEAEPGSTTSWLIEKLAPCGSTRAAVRNPGSSWGATTTRPPSCAA